MKYLLFPLMVVVYLVFFTSCQGEQAKEQDISSLEEAVEQAPTKNNMTALAEQYEAYVAEHSIEDVKRRDYLMKAASLRFRAGEVYPAAELLRQSIRDYFPAQKTDESIIALANMQFLHMNDSTGMDSLLMAFRACFPEEDAMKDKLLYLIDTEGARTSDSISEKINREASLNFMNLTELYGRLYVDTEEGAEQLLESAKMAVFFGQFQRALTIYEHVYQRHPASDIGGNALFMKGFTLDNHLSDYESAGQAYRSFLEEFPNHNLLPSASFLLENLGKSEEEIISSFKQEG